MSDPVKVLPMAQLLRLARDKEELERQEGAQGVPQAVETGTRSNQETEETKTPSRDEHLLETTTRESLLETERSQTSEQLPVTQARAATRITSLPSRSPRRHSRAENQRTAARPSSSAVDYIVDIHDKDPGWQAFITKWLRFETLKPKSELIPLIKFIYDRTEAIGVKSFITSTGEICNACGYTQRNHVFPRLNALIQKGFIEKVRTGSNKKNEGLRISFFPQGPLRFENDTAATIK